jgi:hypothetical protein
MGGADRATPLPHGSPLTRHATAHWSRLTCWPAVPAVAVCAFWRRSKTPPRSRRSSRTWAFPVWPPTYVLYPSWVDGRAWSTVLPAHTPKSVRPPFNGRASRLPSSNVMTSELRTGRRVSCSAPAAAVRRMSSPARYRHRGVDRRFSCSANARPGEGWAGAFRPTGSDRYGEAPGADFGPFVNMDRAIRHYTVSRE